MTDMETNMTVCRPSSIHSLCPLECHQGLCKIVNGHPKCKCPIDFEGEFCERYRCSGYCLNHGVCYVDAQRTTYHENINPPLNCKCSPAWTGDRCDVPVVKCRDPCYNGECTSFHGIETCVCALGFTGRFCEMCEELHCENGGVCRKDDAGNLNTFNNNYIFF